MRRTRRWALALIYYYRSILYYSFGSTVKSFTPPSFENFWNEGLNVWKQEGYNYFYFVSLERMDRSPIENNTRPTLRGTSTCFRGSPGGFNRPTTYPPLPFVYLHRYLSSNFNGVRTLTGKAERIVFTPSRFD